MAEFHVGEIDTGNLLTKNDPCHKVITIVSCCKAKGNVRKQLISKYHTTPLVVTFGQIYNVWSDL